MIHISSIGTYLPPWGEDRRRIAGPDHDALTMAVAAGLRALENGHAVERVVLVTRDLPLLEGGNAAALLAGLGLPRSTEVIERNGGACAAVDAALAASPRTLVIGTDARPPGASAVVIADGEGLGLQPLTRLARSLPVRTRSSAGTVHEYDDPRLLRERGFRTSHRELALQEKPVAVVGIAHSEAVSVCAGTPPRMATDGASAPFFALADLAERGTDGPVLAVDQASITAVRITGGSVATQRDEASARPAPPTTYTSGPEIPISLASYDRAFESKLTLSAGRCNDCGELSFPPRRLCLGCRAENASTLVPLPRSGSVYTITTISVPIPSMHSPYSLAIVELDDVGVRVLAKVTDTQAGSIAIGDRGRMVLRRVATRAGVPDYGYSFLPDDMETGR